MATHARHDSSARGQTPSAEARKGIWRGILIGLIPLGLLLVLVAGTALLTTLARLVFASAEFLAQQQAAVIVLIVGLILTIVVFVMTIWRVLRRVAIWQQNGAIRQ